MPARARSDRYGGGPTRGTRSAASLACATWHDVALWSAAVATARWMHAIARGAARCASLSSVVRCADDELEVRGRGARGSAATSAGRAGEDDLGSRARRAEVCGNRRARPTSGRTTLARRARLRRDRHQTRSPSARTTLAAVRRARGVAARTTSAAVAGELEPPRAGGWRQAMGPGGHQRDGRRARARTGARWRARGRGGHGSERGAGRAGRARGGEASDGRSGGRGAGDISAAVAERAHDLGGYGGDDRALQAAARRSPLAARRSSLARREAEVASVVGGAHLDFHLRCEVVNSYCVYVAMCKCALLLLCLRGSTQWFEPLGAH
jgi:uncharacterized membrane protein YgcG